MYFLHAINSDRQIRLLNVLGQIAMILGDKKNYYYISPKLKVVSGTNGFQTGFRLRCDS